MTTPLMGRALLWANALSDARDCLDLALRLQALPGDAGLKRVEAQSAATHLSRLAIVYFGQLYTPAFEAPPAVASNKDASAEREALERHAFGNHVDLARFHALRDVVLDLRHRTIAHADGGAFSIHHDSGSTRSLTPVLTPELYEQLREACARLFLALLQRAGTYSAAR